jgi:[acyl-carrier-protein] S-malonyltransferase
MGASTYILCPGQGAQAVGMGRDFYERSPEARAVFDRANDLLGVDLAAICFEGPEERLNQTDVAQPAIFVTSLACHAAAVAAGKLERARVTGFAGLSLGEYTALHLAGVFDFATGLRLVQARGRYMQEAALSVPSGMVSIIGADEDKVAELCELADEGHILVPANYNCPGQVVVSGALSACQRIEKLAADAGFRAIPLKVAGAFHSPLMQPAADRLAEDLEQLGFSPPSHPVWSNVTAAPHEGPESIKKLLIKQITEPVRWSQTMQKLVAADAEFIELAPGRVLAGLLKKVERRAPITSLNTAETVFAS